MSHKSTVVELIKTVTLSLKIIAENFSIKGVGIGGVEVVKSHHKLHPLLYYRHFS